MSHALDTAGCYADAFADLNPERIHPTLGRLDAIVMGEIENLMRRAAALGSSGARARREGDEAAADDCFRSALDLAVDAASRTASEGDYPDRLQVLRAAALMALDCGEVAEARRLIEEAIAAEPSAADTSEWAQLRDVESWPDAWLIAAVRRDPPDPAALDVIVDRYWQPLFGRCQMLTLNREKARDLAQEAWCRVLRSRHTLKPGGNFPAYLTTIATNAWRDSQRTAKRAGPMAEHRIASLEATLPAGENDGVVLLDTLPDLHGLPPGEQARLKLDIDQALEQLSPLLREVLVARLISGESCAEIGARHGRTEQTVSGWVREAIQQMKLHLEDTGPGPRQNQDT